MKPATERELETAGCRKRKSFFLIVAKKCSNIKSFVCGEFLRRTLQFISSFSRRYSLIQNSRGYFVAVQKVEVNCKQYFIYGKHKFL